MATKKEIFALAMELCVEHKASEKLVAALTDLLESKSGGATVNVEDAYDGDNLLCSVSGVWLPATEEFFYADKAGKGFGETGLKRVSRQGEAIRKAHNKTVTASEKAIMSDVLDGEMKVEEGKAKIADLKASKPDYSGVTDVLPSDEDTEDEFE